MRVLPQRLGDVVDATSAPGVAPQQPPDGEPYASQHTVPSYRDERVLRARGVVLAGWPGHRGDDALIGPDEPDQHEQRDPLDEPPRTCDPAGRASSCVIGLHGHAHASADRRSHWATARLMQDARSWSSRAKSLSEDAGSALTTTRVRGGNVSRYAEDAARRRRFTLFRCTALPTALDTTKPTCGGSSPPGSWER